MAAAAFTIVAKNYLPFARVLMSSLRASQPDLRLIVILVDRPQGYFDPAAEDFEVVLSEELGIPNSRWFHFKYTILELSTAVKPYAAQYIFERFGVDRLLYFDPDIYVYDSVQPLLKSLDEHSIVLTPHLTAPLEDEYRPADLDILRSGSFNLGFIGIRNCEESLRFLAWWQVKLYDHCVVDLAKGLFVDQRWVDLVPGMFGGVGVLRDPGLNVAYWNLGHRRITAGRNGFEVNGQPLCFFHFSGFDPDNPHAISRHQNRFTLDDIGPGRELYLEYRRRLADRGYTQCRTWPYYYGAFENGFAIPDMGRPTHHEAPELVAGLSDPFSDEGYRAFLEVWNHPLSGPNGKPSGVTRLAYRIYRARMDVQSAMPDIFNYDLLPFLNWVISSGRREHNLTEVFVTPIREAVRVHQYTTPPAPEKAFSPGRPLVNEKVIAALKQRGIWVDEGAPIQVEALNQLIGNGNARLHLSQLSKAIYESRADLQRLFPDPCGRSGPRFLAWFLTYGAYEYRLSEALLSPLRAQWETLLDSLNHPWERLWHRSVLMAMGGSLRLRSGLGSSLSRVRLTRSVASFRMSQMLRRSAGPDGVTAGVAASTAAISKAGINIIGYIESEMGVGESARCAVRAARSAGLAVAIKGVDSPGPYRRGDRSIEGRDDAPDHQVNIFHVNADQAERIMQNVGESFVANRYNIGYWAWELEEFPDRWLPALRFFNEIWTPSTFCQTAIARKSRIPVIRMPHAIELQPCTTADRSALGIPAEAFVFLAIFDLLSIFERKNPLGVIEAFREAFSGSPTSHLVLKINHGEQRPTEMARIQKAACGLPVTIIDRTIDRAEVSGLIEMADCLVSLHRSEGFGLTIAEAMYLEKPVVATGYSGNLDFTRADNAFLVDYDLATVPRGCEPYDEGNVWAEPRIDSAVSQMRLVAGNPAEREVRARRGCEYVRTHLSPEAVGKLMAARLDILSR